VTEVGRRGGIGHAVARRPLRPGRARRTDHHGRVGARLDILIVNHTLSGSDGTVNTVNSGPGDRDYLTGEAYEAVAADVPAGRWGMPDDPARLIAWLATDETGRITGEVVKSDERSRR
jgi:hypothetical protein